MNTLMDFIYPIILCLIFFGILLYVLNPKRKMNYEKDAKIPFETLTQVQENEEKNK